MRINDGDDTLSHLRAGEVVELTVTGRSNLVVLIDRLQHALAAGHLSAVPVGRLMHDAQSSV